MPMQRTVEFFTAGCPLCDASLRTVRELAGDSWRAEVRDLHDPATAERAATLGIRSAPAVVVDGTLASCCAGRGVDEAVLRAAGLG